MPSGMAEAEGEGVGVGGSDTAARWKRYDRRAAMPARARTFRAVACEMPPICVLRVKISGVVHSLTSVSLLLGACRRRRRRDRVCDMVSAATARKMRCWSA